MRISWLATYYIDVSLPFLAKSLSRPNQGYHRWTLPAPSRRKAGIAQVPDSGGELRGLAHGMDYSRIRRSMERAAGIGFVGIVAAAVDV